MVTYWFDCQVIEYAIKNALDKMPPDKITGRVLYDEICNLSVPAEVHGGTCGGPIDYHAWEDGCRLGPRGFRMMRIEDLKYHPVSDWVMGLDRTGKEWQWIKGSPD